MYFNRTSESNLKLILVFLIIVLSISIKVVFNESGYLSNDSTNYLFLAENIVNGHGYYTHSESGGDGERELFSSWPIGYSTIISTVAIVTGLSVFVSSKVINIVFIGLMLLLFKKISPANAWVYALIFLFSSYLEIYSFTWSEAGFIFGLVLFSYYLYKFINNNTNLYFLTFMLLLSVLFLFLIRYIGAFTIGVFGITWIYLLIYKRDNKKKIVATSLLIVLNITIVVSYLYFNYIETGLTSGRPRVLAPESNYLLFVTLVKALLAEVSIITYHSRASFLIPTLLFQFLLIYFYLYKYKKKRAFSRSISTSIDFYKILILVGVSYLVCIVTIRWFFYFNEYSFRLLGPGSFLLFMALINYFENVSSEEIFEIVKKNIAIFAAISFLLYVPVKTYSRYEHSYQETLDILNLKYEKIPAGSILAFETNKHLKYFKKNIIIKRPLFKETVEEFFERVNPEKNKRVFIEISKRKDILKYDKSIQDLFFNKSHGDIIEIY
jgi:hypothetical protein